MKLNKLIKTCTTLMIGFTMPFMAMAQEGATVPAPKQSGTQAKIAELEEEFRSISSKLSEIEMQAMANDKVSDARDTFNDMVEEEVIRSDPELEEAVAERSKYAEYIQTVQSGGDLPDDVDLNEVYSKYNSLHQKVMPVEQQVMQKQKLQEAYQDYQQKLVSQMRSIDDDVTDYIERQQEIRNEYQQLVSEGQG